MPEETGRHPFEVTDLIRPIDMLPSLARAGGPDPDVSLSLIASVAKRTGARLAHLQKVLAAAAPRTARCGGIEVLEEIRRALRDVSPASRLRLLHGPDLRGFLASAELWVEVIRQAERLEVDPSDRRARTRLFTLLAATEHLTSLLPLGRIDPVCAARAGRFACRALRRAVADLAACLAGIRLLQPGGGPADLRLEFHTDPELGRPGDRIDLGTIHTPAGPLSLLRPAGRASAASARRAVRVRVERGTLRVRPVCGPALVLPLAASRLRFPAGRVIERPHPAPPGALRLARRPSIPGSPIILTPSVRSSPGRLSVGRQVRGLDARLGRALRAVGILWPEMRAEVVQRTAMVVPIRESGLVSYSLAARPGVSFINVDGKRIIELADDLVHETAHHLLHDVQELARLLSPGHASDEVQAFDSPWRATRRPLHGIMPGCYTFRFRAELLVRLRDANGPNSRLLASLLGRGCAGFARREAVRELAMLRDGLGQLATAARAGLLTPAGRRFVRAMRVWYAALVASE